MWASGRDGEIINLDRFDVLRIEGNALVVRRGDEHLTLFHGEHDECRTAYCKCIDALSETSRALILARI